MTPSNSTTMPRVYHGRRFFWAAATAAFFVQHSDHHTITYCAAYPDPVPTPGARYDLIWGADDSPQLRVTVLTDRLLRVQYAAHGAHAVHDLPTTAVINRRFPLVPDVQASSSDKIFRLETQQIKFEYDTSKPNWPDGFRLLELKEKDVGKTAIISSASGGEGIAACFYGCWPLQHYLH